MVGILSCRQTFKAFKVEKREDETANWRVGNQDDRSADDQTSCHNNFHLQGLEGGGRTEDVNKEALGWLSHAEN